MSYSEVDEESYRRNVHQEIKAQSLSLRGYEHTGKQKNISRVIIKQVMIARILFLKLNISLFFYISKNFVALYTVIFHY